MFTTRVPGGGGGGIHPSLLSRSLSRRPLTARRSDDVTLSLSLPLARRALPPEETGGRVPLSDAGSVSAMPTVLAFALHDDDRRQQSSAPVVRGYCCGVDRRLAGAGVAVFGAAARQRQRAVGRSGGQVRRTQEHDGLRAQPAVQLRRPHARI